MIFNDVPFPFLVLVSCSLIFLMQFARDLSVLLELPPQILRI